MIDFSYLDKTLNELYLEYLLRTNPTYIKQFTVNFENRIIDGCVPLDSAKLVKKTLMRIEGFIIKLDDLNKGYLDYNRKKNKPSWFKLNLRDGLSKIDLIEISIRVFPDHLDHMLKNVKNGKFIIMEGVERLLLSNYSLKFDFCYRQKNIKILENNIDFSVKKIGDVLKLSPEFRAFPKIRLAELDKNIMIKSCLKINADIETFLVIKISKTCTKCQSLINNCICGGQNIIFTKCFAKLVANNYGIRFYVYIYDLSLLCKIFDLNKIQKSHLNKYFNEYGDLDFYCKGGFVPRANMRFDKRKMISMFTKIPKIKTIYGYFWPSVRLVILFF